METLTKPSITRLSRKAGVKSLSEDCYNTIRNLINTTLNEIITVSLIVNSESKTKTLKEDDIYQAIQLCGYNIAKSNDLGIETCTK